MHFQMTVERRKLHGMVIPAAAITRLLGKLIAELDIICNTPVAIAIFNATAALPTDNIQTIHQAHVRRRS